MALDCRNLVFLNISAPTTTNVMPLKQHELLSIDNEIGKDQFKCILATWLLLFKQRERNLNQSKDDSFVERVAKNNS